MAQRATVLYDATAPSATAQKYWWVVPAGLLALVALSSFAVARKANV